MKRTARKVATAVGLIIAGFVGGAGVSIALTGPNDHALNQTREQGYVRGAEAALTAFGQDGCNLTSRDGQHITTGEVTTWHGWIVAEPSCSRELVALWNAGRTGAEAKAFSTYPAPDQVDPQTGLQLTPCEIKTIETGCAYFHESAKEWAR